MSTVVVAAGWTFTQGLLVGQASFLFLCVLFIRYVVFSPSEEDEEGWKAKRAAQIKKKLLSTTAVPSPSASQLLQKTTYDMATHPAESTGWLNVLLSQILQGYRNDLLSEGGEEGARQRVERWMNPEGAAMSWLDPIQVTALSLGSSFPLLSNARIRPADGQGHIRAEIDVDYSDSLSLSLSTSVLINFPRPRFAVLPVSLGVELASIGGTLSLQIHDPGKDLAQHIHACLLPDFHLHLKTTTLLGSRAKLQDIPKLEQLVLSRLRAVIQDRFVYPNHLTLTLPRLLRSSTTTTPTDIVSDIGHSALQAMSGSLSQAINTLVSDSPPSTSFPTPLPTPSHPSNPITPVDPTGPISPVRGQKSIPMPLNFPRPPSSYQNSPISTPRPLTSVKPSNPLGITGLPGRQDSYVHSQTTPSVAYTSASKVSMTAQEKEAFRFRGHFASQPLTPGQVGVEHENVRHGVLNARMN
ncbi:hypothetical protein TREMEDRAFT_71793 [Tremella mesenterica DSM 1558]|uniref:uncharacterized protein n=1 Tax=Tremella mesenterica (strain ATCC 24925 / CBS 8224 / DSM 1558 / NBRC 9311 / NRRL Y-6157 / RJB 2259-6 / UBC 559-6) TaxID=578456 RepID=UPI0003F491A9|nr:uncharacterized protein TREMEDRAFT_71793 [Tremella mesenterica DSM 1558]EIW69132.1 hypothetical protein TREMEDRAFT_71793 [Tremella mesenterica DSM 1558]